MNQTTASRPLVIVTRRLPAATEKRLGELFNVRLNPDDHPFSPEELVSALQEADILLATLPDRLTADLIAKAGPQLRMIANFGAGTDHIDLKACAERKIIVTNTPGVLTDDTADITLMLILMALRRAGEGERHARTGLWQGWAPTFMLGHCLKGKTLGIVGMGRIGQAVARRAAPFGLKTLYHNRKPVDPALEAELATTYCQDIEAMLAQTDILTLTCPYTHETHHLISAERMEKLKPTAFLVNTARGPVIDETALETMLKAGTLAGAGLDVYEREPAISPGLLALENVVLLPHLGTATEETRTAMDERVIINIQSVLNHHTPPNRIT